MHRNPGQLIRLTRTFSRRRLLDEVGPPIVMSLTCSGLARLGLAWFPCQSNTAATPRRSRRNRWRRRGWWMGCGMNYNGKQWEKSADIEDRMNTTKERGSRWVVCGPEIWCRLFNSLHGSSQGSEELTISPLNTVFIGTTSKWEMDQRINSIYIFPLQKFRGVNGQLCKITTSHRIPSPHRKRFSHPDN